MSDTDVKLPKWAVSVEAGPGQDGKQCLECRRWLTLESFHRKRTTRDGLKAECKECMGRYQTVNAHVMRRARRKYEIVHERRPEVFVDGGSAERLRRFAETGADDVRPSERDAAARLRAFEMGASGIYTDKETD